MKEEKILYLECYSGISGDMTVGALLDLGASEDRLREELAKLPVEGYKIKVIRKNVSGLAGCDFDVILTEEQHGHSHVHNHNHYKEIKLLLENSKLNPRVKELSLKMFQILAEAEAKVHGVPTDSVAFHEVGAVDSIVDIVSVAACLVDLGIERTVVSELWEGCGTTCCQHGRIPVPVPAVMEMITKFALPIHLTKISGEMVTPTGAAIAAALQTEEMPGKVRVKKNGMGTGKKVFAHPNILRAMILEKVV